MFDEPIGDSVHLRLRAQAPFGDHSGSLALNKTEDDLATTTHDCVRGSHATPSNLFPFAMRKPQPSLNDFCLDQGGAPSTGVLGTRPKCLEPLLLPKRPKIAQGYLVLPAGSPNALPSRLASMISTSLDVLNR